MKITFYSNMTNRQKALSFLPQLSRYELAFFKLNEKEELLRLAPDTQILVADAMACVDKDMISSLKSLALIQSEGVGYQGFDVDFAKERGIIVCNNKGINNTAVAEGTLLLILGCLKSITSGQKSVYEGRQIEVKSSSFGVVRELSECSVGLIGFGDIARQTARLLNAFGARVLYSNRTRYKELEEEYGVQYCTQEELLAQSDFVSLHVAVTDDTRNMADSDFFKKMKSSAYLINTARGDLVDNSALLSALLNGEIAGAGLDVISPEPVKSDNILLDDRVRDKLVLTPHIAGITHLTVEKLYKNIGENIKRFSTDKELINVV